jgi:hypothetical protein
VAYTHLNSLISFENCQFYKNFAVEGGIAMISTDGKSNF